VKQSALAEARERATALKLSPSALAKRGVAINQDGVPRSALELLAYPDIGWDRLLGLWPELGTVPADIAEQLAIDARYDGYLDRQRMDIAAYRRDEALELPADLDYRTVGGLSNEVKQKLETHRPATLGQAAPPKVGAYWAAAGIFFTTFKLLDTFALAMVQFGSEFAVNILGVSTISQPPEVGPDQALVYLELAMKLSFRPSDGVFSMEAQLTPNSFVLVKECRVTGGFAFYLWFKDNQKLGISAGDFVLPLLGLIVLPYTTLFYVLAWAPVGGVDGIGWAFVFLGFIFDVAHWVGGGVTGRRRYA